MRRKLSLISIFILLSAFFSAADLHAVPIDFSAFGIIDPTATVFGVGNSSVLIEEDPSSGYVTLLEWGMSVPDNAVSLTLDYSLHVEAGNEDYFTFYFDSLSAPAEVIGGYEGIYTGTLTGDLTEFAGNRLSLAVSLNFGWDDFGFESVLKITDAEIITAAVPEPSGFALLCIGLLGLAKIRKKHTGRMPQSRQSA